MAHINRKYIDKHWLMFVVRGCLAAIFGFFILFRGGSDEWMMVTFISVFLLLMGIIDSIGALYASVKKHGWFNSIIDAMIDVVAAVALLFMAKNNLATGVIIISVYTILSGIVDLFHGFLSTVDPTDRFIRVLVGVFGCVIGIAILNAGGFEKVTFARFFGVYMLVVGTTSLIYGVHNRAQRIEDRTARKESAKKKPVAKKTTRKKA